MKTVRFVLILLCGVCLHTQAQIKIFTIGDSTMSHYDESVYSFENEQRGWGQLLQQLVSPDVEIINRAKGGRSSKSFYNEFWGELIKEIQQDDYLFIQFGHNDEKADGLDTDPLDFTARGTAPWSQYQQYLRKYIEEARAKGAIPILFTPVVRLAFEQGVLTKKALHDLDQTGNDSILNYPLAMKAVAKELAVPLIDLTTATQKLVESYGAVDAKEFLYVKKDNTHLSANGAFQFTVLAIEGLRKERIFSNSLTPIFRY